MGGSSRGALAVLMSSLGMPLGLDYRYVGPWTRIKTPNHVGSSSTLHLVIAPARRCEMVPGDAGNQGYHWYPFGDDID
jgi:hypothetical protein